MPVAWPGALRAVRGWLETWVMLRRYSRAFSDLYLPPELGALLELVFSGRGLHLYALQQQTTAKSATSLICEAGGRSEGRAGGSLPAASPSRRAGRSGPW